MDDHQDCVHTTQKLTQLWQDCVSRSRSEVWIRLEIHTKSNSQSEDCQLGRIFVMVQLCNWNDFGSLWLRSQFAIRVLALLLPFSL
jgi:hypothetical protein